MVLALLVGGQALKRRERGASRARTLFFLPIPQLYFPEDRSGQSLSLEVTLHHCFYTLRVLLLFLSPPRLLPLPFFALIILNLASFLHFSLSLSVPIEGHDNHDPREISNAPRLLRAASLISRREPPSSLLLPHPLLAVRGTASSSNGITRKHETLRRDNLVRGPRLSFERAVVGNFQRQFHATTPPSFPAGHSLHQFPAGIVAKLRGSLCLSSGVALIHRIFEFRAKFVKRGREKFSFSLRVKFEGNGDKGGKIMARIKLRN